MADPVTVAAVGWGIKVAGWIISPIMSRLLRKGFSYLGFCSPNKLKKFEMKVLQLKLMLEAAEASPCSGRLEPWIKELRSAFYEAGDILDDIDYQQLEKRLLSQSGTSDSDGANFWSRKTQVRMKLKQTLDMIEKLVDEGYKLLSLLKLPANGECFNDTPNSTLRSPTRTTSSAPVVFGRDGDLKMIRRKLHHTPANDESSSSNSNCYSVIGLHGIPGSGKTTLAQYVCEKERGDNYFDLILWIHVSMNFSVNAALSEMLEIASGGGIKGQFGSLEMLQRELESKLRGKRFLLVLDDIWYGKGDCQQKLDSLRSPLKAGMRGSKILTTSRTTDAASALGAQDLVPIPELDKDEFFKMFLHYALDGARISDQALLTEYQLIGRQIAIKLGGSPLAARTVAGQLRRRLDIEFWRRSLNRDLLNDTMGALWWSYQQLEENVRQCFTYCSMFPRRYEFQRDELVQLWVAEGFVETANATEDMEDVGHDCFDVLLACSFIQLKENGRGTKYFTIHDLLHELAGRVAGSDCFRIEKGFTGQIPRGVRHLFIDSYDPNVFIVEISKLDTLHTLVMSSAKIMSVKVFELMLVCLKKLRVVNVRLNLEAVPACIRELKQLRYLGLFDPQLCNITLPATFAKLYHLQKFYVPPATKLQCFSNKELSNLVNLRDMLPLLGLGIPDIGRMTCLRTLFVFMVKKARGYEIQQLEHLDNLRGTLHIEGLRNVRSKDEACQAKLDKKVLLRNLVLRWNTVEDMLEIHDNQTSKKTPENICKAGPSSYVTSNEIEEGMACDQNFINLKGPTKNMTFEEPTKEGFGTFKELSYDSEESNTSFDKIFTRVRSCGQSPDPQKDVENLEHLGLPFPTMSESGEGRRCNQNLDPQKDAEVLEALCPPSMIMSLIIKGYCGSTYPSWLCGEQGKLENLQCLEFYNCNGTDAPPKISESFKSLRALVISNCSWSSIPENMEHITSLKNLTISGCKNFQSLARLPLSLRQLTLDNWNGLYAPPGISKFLINIRTLKISNCSWSSLPEDMEHLTSLKELTIQGCEIIRSLPRLPSSLKKFTLRWCNRRLMRSCQSRTENWESIAHIKEKIIIW